MVKKLRSQPLSMKENEQLSEKVRNYPCLYDKTKKSHKGKNICFNAWRAVCLDLKFLEAGKNNKYFFYGFIKGHPEFFTFRKSYFFS